MCKAFDSKTCISATILYFLIHIIKQENLQPSLQAFAGLPLDTLPHIFGYRLDIVRWDAPRLDALPIMCLRYSRSDSVTLATWRLLSYPLAIITLTS